MSASMSRVLIRCWRASKIFRAMSRRGAFVCQVLLAMLAICVATARGQVQQAPVVMGAQVQPGQGRSYPPPSYYFGFNELNDGDYKNALQIFNRELRGAYRNGQSRWIDSICDYAMVGECQYRMGDYAAALESYEAALRLYVQTADWMLHVQFPPTLGNSGNSRGTPWGSSTRGSRPARIPETLPLGVGMFNPNQTLQVLQQGGVLQAPMYLSVNTQEVVRCTVLAMMRRQEILGPLTTRDSLTDDVLAQAIRRQGPPNNWSEAWLDAIQGTAYNAAGKTSQASTMLKHSLLMLGQFDHGLTGMALLQLGQMAFDASDYKTAAGYFEEATYTGYDYSDSTVIGEGFRKLFLAHLLTGDVVTLDNALAAAANWARNKNHEIQASVMAMAAESLALRGAQKQAAAVLSEAAGVVARRTMSQCEIGSRLNYVTALTQYEAGAVPAGDTALNAALAWYKNGGSKWLFQLALADNLCVTNANGFENRAAMALYSQMLRDPTPSDWMLQPLDSLAVLSTPHPLPFEHWFEKAVQQSTGAEAQAQAALEISDLARRHRFLSTQPFGGRMLALRWLLEAPIESLSKQAKLQRQELLTRYPKYAEASDKAQKIRVEITQAGLSPDAKDGQRALMAKFNELATVTTSQEIMLHEIAVRREPAEIVFPPVRKAKEVQTKLGTSRLLLMFFATSHSLYGGFYSADRCSLWKLDNVALLEKRTSALLRALGNYDANHELTETQLTDESWQQGAKDVLASILSNPKTAFNAEFKEMIIVPDSLLWYVPFEILPMGDPKDGKPLITRMRIRYAPTVGLVFSEREGRKASPDLGIVAGKLFPGQSNEFSQEASEKIQHTAAHAVALKTPLPAISPLLGSVLDGIVALDDIPAMQGPFDWLPVPLEKNKNVGSLSAWLGLPWKSSDVFIFPSFHTAAENGLKNVGNGAGNDLFLATTGLMATGARTILISRWRTGGQTAVDLVHQFIQEFPFSTADAAWQRAVQLVSQSPLDPQHEPRIKHKPDAPMVNTDHPFFWAGYLLVDTGAEPEGAQQAAPEKPPVLKMDEKNKPADKKPELKMPGANPAGGNPPDNAKPDEKKPEEEKPAKGA
jgi:tetratricopeptide (TPR) repeat protein